jgi:hypothetical protein
MTLPWDGYTVDELDTAGGKKTSEKFLGHWIWYKEWEGTITAGDTVIPNFFPTTTCRIVSFGGSSSTESVDIEYTIPYYSNSTYYRSIYKTGVNLGCKFAGGNTWTIIVWVKYIHGNDEPTDEPDPTPPVSPASPPTIDPTSPPIIDPISPPIIPPDDGEN